MKIYFTGIQPTGTIHLGNYVSIIKRLLKIQQGLNQNDKLFIEIADLHSLTNRDNLLDKKDIKENSIKLLSYLLASDLNSKQTYIFQQSQIPFINELFWIFSCLVQQSWLNSMPQYKEKKDKHQNLGIYTYPLLQASDILLFKSNMVPVGQDQLQHLELTNKMAQRFNYHFGDYFDIVEFKTYETIKSLTDSSKMSKSHDNDMSRINIDDNLQNILKKIKRAKTDSLGGVYRNKNRPEINNLINIYESLTGQQDIEYQSTLEFKKSLAEKIFIEFNHVQQAQKEIFNDKEYMKSEINRGNQMAFDIGQQNIQQIKNLVNL